MSEQRLSQKVAVAMFAPLDSAGFIPSASQETEAERVIALVAGPAIAEREDWRGKAEHRLNEWRLRNSDALAAEADRDEADAAKEMWRERALKAERDLEKVISG